MTQQPHVVYQPVQQTNGLGLAGFIVSLIGLLVTGGILSPIGLIISLIAVGRQPRGFAIWGIVLGLLGSCGIIMLLLFGGLLLAALGISMTALAMTQGDKMQIAQDMTQIAVAIERYRDENGELPADLGVLALQPSLLIDPWGANYEYHFSLDDGTSVEGTERSPIGFDLVSLGEDGIAGTPDDVKLTQAGNWFNIIGQGMQIDVRGDDGGGGGLTIDLGGLTIEATGDDDGGRIYLTDGNRRIEITGDDHGGTVTIDGKDVHSPGGDGHDGDEDAHHETEGDGHDGDQDAHHETEGEGHDGDEDARHETEGESHDGH